jgi:DNA polymerase-1
VSRRRQAEELFPSLAGQGMIGLDLETKDPELRTQGTALHRGDARIAGVAVATETGFRRYYPVGHEEGPNLDRAKVMSWLQVQLATSQPKVGARLIYDYSFLAKEGIKVEGPLYDVQVAEPLLDENRFQFGLEQLSRDYLGIGKQDEELDAYLVTRFGKKNPKGSIWRAPASVVAPYAIGDVVQPLQIFAKQKVELVKQDLWDLFLMESKLIPMLAAMNLRGVRVDLDRTEAMLGELTKRQEKIEREIKRRTGIAPQIWAAASLQKIFDEIGLPYGRTPKTNQPSFTAHFLDRVSHPVVDLVLEARKLDKLRGTFLQGCILDHHVRGRVHCQFNQLKGEDGGAVTGRFSSSLPNLQFIPIRSETGRLIRSLFLPDEGQAWYKKDYSQIEFRLLVHDAEQLDLPGAGDVAEQYRTNPDVDFHLVVAEMAGLDRQKAKTINFGLAYGEGKDKLAAQLGLPIEEAEDLLRGYHKKVPFMRPLSQHCMGKAAKEGEIITLLGRKRRFNSWETTDRRTGKKTILRHPIPGARRAFTHAALNARTQGSAADIMKQAMVETWESGVCDVLGVPQLTVHDELDGSLPKTKAGREAVREMNRIMESAAHLRVPLRVDSGVGPNWGEAE